MKKKVLNIIITFICISLSGIVAVQYFWIRNAIQVKEAQFNRSVNEALSTAVNKLETREDIQYMKNNFRSDSIHALVQAFSKDPILALNDKLDSLLKRDERPQLRKEERFRGTFPPPMPPLPPMTTMYSFGNNLNANVIILDSLIERYQYMEFQPEEFQDAFTFEWSVNFSQEKMDSLVRASEKRIVNGFPNHRPQNQEQRRKRDQSFTFRSPSRPEPHHNGPPGDMTKIYVERSIDTNTPDPIFVHEDMRIITNKARKIKDIIQKMARELDSKPLPIEKRVDKASLEKVLNKSLSDKDIDLPFEYAVIAPGASKSPVPLRSPGFQNSRKEPLHRISLFPNDIFKKPDVLLVYFPGQRTMILRSLSWLLLGSVFFTLIVILSSILGIYTILRQKKISDIKTDFINNMTHEFKTPIATISIAVDSINNPKVIDEPEKIKSYTRVIKEENNRMNARVEQVLQMALLDSSEFMLNLKTIDVNALLMKVSENIRLQIESREGKIEVNPEAVNSIVEGDETHLSNVFMNLLDNANKYSPEKPQISIRTFNRGSSLIVTVEDNGIGMNDETRRKIFDKFFRVTSGNIHNVKGFGLGLSYSKAIVLAHHGEINVTSGPGKGSRFEVALPVGQVGQVGQVKPV